MGKSDYQLTRNEKRVLRAVVYSRLSDLNEDISYLANKTGYTNNYIKYAMQYDDFCVPAIQAICIVLDIDIKKVKGAL